MSTKHVHKQTLNAATKNIECLDCKEFIMTSETFKKLAQANKDFLNGQIEEDVFIKRVEKLKEEVDNHV